MGGKPEPVFKIGDYWLGKKSGRDTWYRYWWDRERKCNRRASLGTTDLEEAKEKLAEWFVAQKEQPELSDLEQVLLADVIRVYYEKHAQHLQSHDTSRLNLNRWLDFYEPGTTIKDATRPKRIDAFISHLQNGDLSAAYINRILTDGRSAINKAWKDGVISSSPFIKSLSLDDAEPKGRPMEMDELRLFYHTAPGEHLKRFILWTLGTGARPSSVFDLHREQINLERELIDLNPRGRKQTKKIRPEVKLPSHLKPFVCDGFQITFRGKPVKDVKTAWRNQRKNCNFDDRVQPYSLRHTIARHLRASGVPAWEVSAQLGHKKKEHSITEIYAPMDPSYLGQSVAAIDAFLAELLACPDDRPLMTLPKRCPSEKDENPRSVVNIGAGDEIRTHDPNLGKVRLLIIWRYRKMSPT